MSATLQEQLDALADYGPRAGDDGAIRLSVSVANSQGTSEAEYERSCDQQMADVKGCLLPGWCARWTGSGNTDHLGECTEDILIEAEED